MKKRTVAPILVRILVIAVIAVLALACRKKAEPAVGDSAVTMVVKQDTEGLLLTWIDEKGDFHTELKLSDVPLIGRDAVRVVDPSSEEANHSDKVLIADLRVAKADGTFTVRPMTRLEWDQLAVARRQKQGLATMPSAAPSGDVPFVPLQQANARPQVVIYGASWCGACHDAAAYLRQRGVSYVEKDIEADAEAAREMSAKLAKIGQRGGSIPVLDVRGKVLVGFSPHAVDEALGKAI